MVSQLPPVFLGYGNRITAGDYESIKEERVSAIDSMSLDEGQVEFEERLVKRSQDERSPLDHDILKLDDEEVTIETDQNEEDEAINDALRMFDVQDGISKVMEGKPARTVSFEDQATPSAKPQVPKQAKLAMFNKPPRIENKSPEEYQNVRKSPLMSSSESDELEGKEQSLDSLIGLAKNEIKHIAARLKVNRQDAVEAFHACDADADGKVSAEELFGILSAEFCFRHKLHDKQDKIHTACERLLKKYDVDNSGYLDQEEFTKLHDALATELEVERRKERKLNWITTEGQYHEVEKARQIFFEYDESGEGFLDKHEFEAVIYDMGLFLSDRDLSSRLEMVLDEVDDNDDFNISFEEFLNFFRRFLIDAHKFIDTPVETFSKLVSNKLSKKECEQAKLLFQQADRDKSGTIDVQEMHILLQKLEVSSDKDNTLALAMLLVNRSDVDGTGTLTFEEFKSIYITLKELQISTIASQD